MEIISGTGIEANTYEACTELCEITPNCNAFIFNSAMSVCQLRQITSSVQLVPSKDGWSAFVRNCPDSIIDGGWTEWGECTATCQGGIRTRECSNPATANGGLACEGEYIETCNTDILCDPMTQVDYGKTKLFDYFVKQLQLTNISSH